MGLFKLAPGRMALPLAMALCVLVTFGCSAPPTSSTKAPDTAAKPTQAAAAAAPTAAKAADTKATETKAPDTKAASSSEKYPSRPIDFIVPWGPGGGADQLARKLGSLAEKELGVSLPAINVAGATGGTGAAKLLAAPNDGYSIAVFIADSLAAVASGDAAYTHKDFAPIIRAQLCPSYLFVRTDGPYKSWKDVEDAAKAKPGQLKIAITGQGSLDEATSAYLGSKGIKINPVPYPTPGERYAALLGGHADLLYEQAGDVRQYLTNNQIKPVIIFREKRLESFPDVPCSKELGYDIFLPQFRTIVAKAGTDPARIKVLADAFEKATKTPDWAAFGKEQYMTDDSFMGTDAVTKFLDGEYETTVNLMKQLGLKSK